MGLFLLGAMVVPSSKIVINLPLTYWKLVKDKYNLLFSGL